jgi:hypothetical protein
MRRSYALALSAGSAVVVVSLVGPRLSAQPIRVAANAPIACYLHASDEANLSRQLAMELCLAAPSDAPARCAEAVLETTGIGEQQVVELCRGSSSNAPALCASRLDNEGYTDQQIVQFCPALAYALRPSPTAGSPDCLQAGDERHDLTDTEVIRLCSGSSSPAPVECFDAGEDQAPGLSDSDLVTLCAPQVVWPYGVRLY